MKATLTFDLDDHDDKLAHKRAISATDAYITLHEIDNMLREYTKYSKDINEGDSIALPEKEHVLTEVESNLLNQFALNIRYKIGNILEDHGVNMDDLQ